MFILLEAISRSKFNIGDIIEMDFPFMEGSFQPGEKSSKRRPAIVVGFVKSSEQLDVAVALVDSIIASQVTSQVE